MKILFLPFILLLTLVNLYGEPLTMEIEGEAAILMNADTGAILFEKNAHDVHFPASTTKVATALFVLQDQNNQLDRIISAKQEVLGTVTHETKKKSNYTLPPYVLEPDGTHIG